MGDWVGLKQPRICYTTGNASTSLFKHPACSSQGYHAVNTPVHPFLVHIPILNGWNSPHVSWFPAQQIFPWAKLQSDAGDRLLCLTNVPQLEVGHGAWRSLWESKKRRHPRHGGKMWKIGPWNSWYGQLKITLRLECVLCSDSIKNWTIEMGISTIKWCTPSSKIFPNFREKKTVHINSLESLEPHWNPIGIPLVQLRRSKAPVAPSKVHSMPCRVATKKCLGCHFGGETIWCTCKKSLGGRWENVMFRYVYTVWKAKCLQVSVSVCVWERNHQNWSMTYIDDGKYGYASKPWQPGLDSWRSWMNDPIVFLPKPQHEVIKPGFAYPHSMNINHYIAGVSNPHQAVLDPHSVFGQEK